jgi:hypothetical protein
LPSVQFVHIEPWDRAEPAAHGLRIGVGDTVGTRVGASVLSQHG